MTENKFKGLSEEQVIKSRAEHGRNEIDEDIPESFLSRVIDSLKDPMLILLICIATFMLVLSLFGMSEWYESAGTFVAIALVSVITAKTGMTADSRYRELKEATKKEGVKVIREDKLVTIDISEVVVGDIVILQNGDKVPADGILLDGGIKINNSSLNGETEECLKTGKEVAVFPNEVNGDTLVNDNTLFKDTTVYNGEGIMQVCRVGMKTMAGEMAEDMKEVAVESPLTVKFGKLAKQISTFGYIGAVVILAVYCVSYILDAGSISNYLDNSASYILNDVLVALSTAIIIVVCAVPEGLPLMVALVLMQNSSKMLNNNVIVRKAIGIETAGSLNILFSDKTGTITQGEFTVNKIYSGSASEVCSDREKNKTFWELLDISICKNTSAMFDSKHDVVGGNLTDKALLKFVGEQDFTAIHKKDGLNIEEYQSFNSVNKFSQVYLKEAGRTYYKGAIEKLLVKATKCVNSEGKVVDIEVDKINDIEKKLTSMGMRVLAFGYSSKEIKLDEINDDVVLIGFVGIRDDIRPEAIEAIKEVREAGIQVVMITGDKIDTAVAIGKEANLLHGEYKVITAEDVKDEVKLAAEVENLDTLAISSEELNKLSEEFIKKVINKIGVIGRALPKDKSRMVRIAQELNLVCGMTGDGVNDSPALKRADVGFAMGSGTEAAKEAGDLVIVDDNFLSIKNAVLYGRTIYHNILKFCKFQLAINVGAVLISALLPYLGIETPLTVIHLLFINLCMDSLGALMLGQEPALQSYMKEKPRRRDESIVNKKMFIQFTIIGLFLLGLSIVWFKSDIISSNFNTKAELKSGFFAVFMFTAIFNGLNVRSNTLNIFKDIKDNKNFLPVVFIMLGATIVLCQISMVSNELGNMFSTTALDVKEWLIIIAVSLTVIPFDMIRKLITK
jgi:P-type Ca2+ transporter type 2C